MAGYAICSYSERIENGQWTWDGGSEPFKTLRSHRHYAFLADVRNDWSVPPIVAPRGLPTDLSKAVEIIYYHPQGNSGFPRYKYVPWHAASWLTVAELMAFNYERTFEDGMPYYDQDWEWYARHNHSRAGHDGRVKTYREFLGQPFFNVLDTLQTLRIERVVFWFA
jgi:hypothetical protein